MTATTDSNSFTAATDAFLREADWLTPLDAPAVASLRIIAAELDRELTAALASSYGLTYRALMKAKPGSTATSDPLEDALRDSQAD